jgi:hypothetical protein
VRGHHSPRKHDLLRHSNGPPDADAILPALKFQFGDTRFHDELDQLSDFII